MFERAVFRRSDQRADFHLDIGQLAEAILYYGEVELLLDHPNLGRLLEVIGHDALVRLVRLPSVRATLVSDNLATVTNTQGFQSHSFVVFSLARKDAKRPNLTKEEAVREIYARKLGSGFRTRKQADFLSQFLTEDSFGRGLAGKSLVESTKESAFDDKYMSSAAKIVLEELVKEYTPPARLKFRAVPFGDEFLIDTNLDFDRISTEWRKKWPKDIGPPTTASLLTEVLEAKAGLGISAIKDADLFHTSITSRLIGLDLARAARTSEAFKEQSLTFSEWVLSGSSVSSVVAAGDRSFDEFLDLVENAEKFKKWVVGVGDDRQLAQEYFKEVSMSGWLDKLPAKALRYVAFGGAGIAVGALSAPVVGAVAGLAISAVDSFLLERFLKGWKPNHFIDNRVKSFVDVGKAM